MKVYIVQWNDWDWKNDSVHSTLEGAKKACKEIINCILDDENEINDCLEQLERELYVDGLCAIDAWEVEE